MTNFNEFMPELNEAIELLKELYGQRVNKEQFEMTLNYSLSKLCNVQYKLNCEKNKSCPSSSDYSFCVVWDIKQKNPFTDEYDNKVYLVPSCDKVQKSKNYVCIIGSKKYQGVYKLPANLSTYKKWSNNGRECYYIDIDDCEKFPISNVQNPNNLKLIKEEQEKYLKYQQKLGKMKTGAPDWFVK